MGLVKSNVLRLVSNVKVFKRYTNLYTEDDNVGFRGDKLFDLWDEHGEEGLVIGPEKQCPERVQVNRWVDGTQCWIR